jgi:hypothetical protein
VPRFSRLHGVVDFVAASLISYYGYANSFSDGPCRHPNSEWLQRRFLSPPELCRSLSQARRKQLSVSFSYPLFFYNNTSYHTMFFSLALPLLPLALLSVLLLPSFLKFLSRWLVFGLELSTERPVGPFPILFALWLVEPIPFPPRLPVPQLEEPETPPPLPPWPLGPKNLLSPLAARPSLLLLALLGLSLRLLPPALLPRAQRFWVVDSASAAPSSQSRPRGTTVFSIKTVRKCVLAAGP